jgi:hypothetical protein
MIVITHPIRVILTNGSIDLTLSAEALETLREAVRADLRYKKGDIFTIKNGSEGGSYREVDIVLSRVVAIINHSTI